RDGGTMRQVVYAGLIAGVAASAAFAQQPNQTARVSTTGTIYYEPTGATCNSTAALTDEDRKVKIKSRGWQSGMISADSAKTIALCYVPGQVSSGEMNSDSARAVYAMTVIPNGKKTHTKVLVDANTGQVLSVKK